MTREVLKEKMEAPQSVDGVPLTVLPSEEMAEHQLVGGVLVGSETLGVLDHKEGGGGGRNCVSLSLSLAWSLTYRAAQFSPG